MSNFKMSILTLHTRRFNLSVTFQLGMNYRIKLVKKSHLRSAFIKLGTNAQIFSNPRYTLFNI